MHTLLSDRSLIIAMTLPDSRIDVKPVSWFRTPSSAAVTDRPKTRRRNIERRFPLGSRSDDHGPVVGGIFPPIIAT
jgi:hypothetical protein